MALHKCPKCELNYIRDGEAYCEVCKREMKRAQARGARTEEEEDEIIMCTECGEEPAVRGGELCLSCLKEKKRQVVLESAASVPGDDDFDEEDMLEEEEETDSDEE
jgi:RecJ-like exonuclease